jgi:hypothetical protein
MIFSYYGILLVREGLPSGNLAFAKRTEVGCMFVDFSLFEVLRGICLATEENHGKPCTISFR